MEDEKIIALYWDRDQTAIAETQQKYGRYCGDTRPTLYMSAGAEEWRERHMDARLEFHAQGAPRSFWRLFWERSRAICRWTATAESTPKREAEASCRIYMKNCMTAPGARSR